MKYEAHTYLLLCTTYLSICKAGKSLNDVDRCHHSLVTTVEVGKSSLPEAPQGHIS